MSGVKAMREHREGRLALGTQRRLVEEGIRDVDEGRAVPHAQVMREAAEWLRKR
jgi:predicted transcriptional regulator